VHGTGRAEITGLREGAKPRSSDEKGTFLPKSTSGLVSVAARRQRPSWATPIVCKRARMDACRLALGGAGGRSGLRARRICLRQGQSSGARNLGSNVFGSPLLLTDNYIQQPRTKPQRHETHKKIRCNLQLWDPCALLAAAPVSRRAALCATRGPAAARGHRSRAQPGRRCRLGGLACLTGARAQEQGGGKVWGQVELVRSFDFLLAYFNFLTITALAFSMSVTL
jgi:hypothetical protein